MSTLIVTSPILLFSRTQVRVNAYTWPKCDSPCTPCNNYPCSNRWKCVHLVITNTLLMITNTLSMITNILSMLKGKCFAIKTDLSFIFYFPTLYFLWWWWRSKHNQPLSLPKLPDSLDLLPGCSSGGCGRVQSGTHQLNIEVSRLGQGKHSMESEQILCFCVCGGWKALLLWILSKQVLQTN